MLKKVYCPVTGTQVDGSDCYTICAVADHEAKPAILWDGVVWDEEQRKKCLSCQYHADIAPGVSGIEKPAMDGYFTTERNLPKE